MRKLNENTKLEKQQKKELEKILKETVKGKMKRRTSNIHVSKDEFAETDAGVSLTVNVYFFTMKKTIADYIGAGELTRWDAKFTTKPYPSAVEAFEAMKTLVSNPDNYGFKEVEHPGKTELYQLRWESEFTEV